MKVNDFHSARVILILDRLRSAHNVGNVFRLAEALGGAVVACGYTPAPPHPKLAKSAMGTERMVPCHIAADAAEAIAWVRTQLPGIAVFAVECNESSVNAWEVEAYPEPLALVVGNEAYGISEATLALCDRVIQLPMFGDKASINVGNALAAVLYAIEGKKTNEL